MASNTAPNKAPNKALNKGIRVAINGFGRMGRLFLRSAWQNPKVEIVLINEPMQNAHTSAHLLEFDSIHGRFEKDNIQAGGQSIQIGDKTINYSQTKALDETDFSGIDLLVECSGLYRQTALFDNVLNNTDVKKVLVSCPVKDADTLNIVYGVNHDDIKPNHRGRSLITNVSIAPNLKCLAQKLLSVARPTRNALT